MVPPEDVKLAYDLKHDVDDVEMPETQLSLSQAIDLSNFTLAKTGVELQLDTLSTPKLFQNVDLFYICEGCGKIYWEGTHMDRVKMNFKDLIDKREIDKNFYGTPG